MELKPIKICHNSFTNGLLYLIIAVLCALLFYVYVKHFHKKVKLKLENHEPMGIFISILAEALLGAFFLFLISCWYVCWYNVDWPVSKLTIDVTQENSLYPAEIQPAGQTDVYEVIGKDRIILKEFTENNERLDPLIYEYELKPVDGYIFTPIQSKIYIENDLFLTDSILVNYSWRTIAYTYNGVNVGDIVKIKLKPRKKFLYFKIRNNVKLSEIYFFGISYEGKLLKQISDDLYVIELPLRSNVFLGSITLYPENTSDYLPTKVDNVLSPFKLPESLYLIDTIKIEINQPNL